MPSPAPMQPPGPRLLLVDDDPTMLMIIGRLVQDKAPTCVLTEASSGEQAVVLLRRQPFDVVLSDYRMDATNGIDVLACAHEVQPEATRILMSGFGDPAMVRDARQRAAIHEFVEKPVSVEDLEASVEAQVIVPHLLRTPTRLREAVG